MTTQKRRPRQADPIKLYGRILKHHRCGRGIFVGDDGRFFATEEYQRAGPKSAPEATTLCPPCGQVLIAEDLDFSDKQCRTLGRFYAMMLQLAVERRMRLATEEQGHYGETLS